MCGIIKLTGPQHVDEFYDLTVEQLGLGSDAQAKQHLRTHSCFLVVILSQDLFMGFRRSPQFFFKHHSDKSI